MAIYHVTREWDGGELKSLAARIDDGEMGLDEGLEMVAGKWFGGDLATADRYLDRDGRQVHCHATLDEAADYRDELCEGGLILAVDDDDIRVLIGEEYPHPVVMDRVPAALVRVVEGSVA